MLGVVVGGLQVRGVEPSDAGRYVCEVHVSRDRAAVLRAVSTLHVVSESLS